MLIEQAIVTKASTKTTAKNDLRNIGSLLHTQFVLTSWYTPIDAQGRGEYQPEKKQEKEGGQSTTGHRQYQRGWMIAVMINSLLCQKNLGSLNDWIAVSQISIPARKSTAGDLQSQAMPCNETICRRPEIDLDTSTAICLEHACFWSHLKKTITDIQ